MAILGDRRCSDCHFDIAVAAVGSLRAEGRNGPDDGRQRRCTAFATPQARTSQRVARIQPADHADRRCARRRLASARVRVEGSHRRDFEPQYL